MKLQERPKGYAFTEYQAAALLTAKSKLGDRDRLASWALGLSGEAGEAAGEIKKWLFHDKPPDFSRLVEELGDVLWYLAAIAEELGLDLGNVAHANIEKLRRRHKGGGFKPHEEQAR